MPPGQSSKGTGPCTLDGDGVATGVGVGVAEEVVVVMGVVGGGDPLASRSININAKKPTKHQEDE